MEDYLLLGLCREPAEKELEEQSETGEESRTLYFHLPLGYTFPWLPRHQMH